MDSGNQKNKKFIFDGIEFYTEQEMENYKKEKKEIEQNEDKKEETEEKKYSYDSDKDNSELCIPENGIRVNPGEDIKLSPNSSGVLFADGVAIAIIDPESGKFYLTADANEKDAEFIEKNFTVNGQKMECIGRTEITDEEIQKTTKKAMITKNRELFGKAKTRGQEEEKEENKKTNSPLSKLGTGEEIKNQQQKPSTLSNKTQDKSKDKGKY